MLICCDLLNDFLWEFHACCWPKFFSVPPDEKNPTDRRTKHLTKPNDILSAPHVWLIEKGKETALNRMELKDSFWHSWSSLWHV